MLEVLTLVFMGALAGVMAGLLGIGGGALIVPVLVIVFEAQGVHPSVVMHSALGTSLATIVFTSISSALAHHRRGAVDWIIFRRIVPALVVGTLFGTAFAYFLASVTLKILFVLFLFSLVVKMGRGGQATRAHTPLPQLVGMSIAGILIGIASALFGIGGGSLAVPFMTWCSVPVKRAVATAAAFGVPIALSGTLGFLLAGLHVPNLPPGSVGYVVLPAFAGIAVSSVLAAPYGARLAHRLPDVMLRRIFALFIAALGVRMLWGLWK